MQPFTYSCDSEMKRVEPGNEAILFTFPPMLLYK